MRQDSIRAIEDYGRFQSPMPLGFLGSALDAYVWDRAGMGVRPPTNLPRAMSRYVLF